MWLNCIFLVDHSYSQLFDHGLTEAEVMVMAPCSYKNCETRLFQLSVTGLQSTELRQH
jgi:hypothetical protein